MLWREFMTDEELEALLVDVESDRVERKESAADGDKLRQAVCAFANDIPNHRQPGILFVGARDDGSPSGIEVSDRLLQTLSSMATDGNIQPFPAMTVSKRKLKGHDMAVVEVHPSDTPPVRHKGVIWIRVGPCRAIANGQQERTLNEKRRFRDLPADIRPMASVPLTAIDELLFRRGYLPSAIDRDVLAQNNRELEQQLIACRFAHPGEPVCPTVLGLLVAGKSPSDWIPCAYVQFVRIDGTTLADPVLSDKELRGALPDLLTELDDLLRINIRTSVDFKKGTIETRTPDYPFAALQQIARNAVLHRTYENTHAPVRIYWFSDRVEVQNPGGPFGQVTRENFGTPGICDYRNPHLAGVMKDLGFVQRFGMGIATALGEMAKNGNPKPEFQVSDAHVAVILRGRL
jgi:ATP-dependent DNA helicase RecG